MWFTHQGPIFPPSSTPLGFPDSSIGKELLQCRRLQFDSWIGKIRWRRDRLPTPVFLDFTCSSTGEESTCNAGDLGLIPGLGWSPGEERNTPVFWPGEFHGLYSPWGIKETDTTELLNSTGEEEKINMDEHFRVKRCDYYGIMRGPWGSLMKLWNIFAKYLWPGYENELWS